MSISGFELVLRLTVAAFLGGVVGLERESHGRPAGFRTHILVCLGSSLVMLVSVYALAQVTGGLGFDPGRMAAQVISGIGFLGAGTILREGANVRGLTTAASLWVVAGIGLAAGSGFYTGAMVTTGLVVITLILLDKVEQRFLTSKGTTVRSIIEDVPGALGKLTSVLGRHGIDIKSIELVPCEDDEMQVDMMVNMPPDISRAEVFDLIRSVECVRRVYC